MKKFAVMVVWVLALTFAGAAGAAELPEAFPAFSSVNLGGESVTSDIFTKEKLTMVNIWTTWCPPCIAEMPDLGNMGRSMPEGSQLIGIVLDAAEPYSFKIIDEAVGEAKRLLSAANADFLQVLPSEQMLPVLEWVEAIPTTIFVDSKGQIAGEPIIGMRSEETYRAEVEKLLK